MNTPTVTDAYAMIRALKKRAAPGDADKIQQLKELIELEKDKSAQLALERFFPIDKAPSKR